MVANISLQNWRLQICPALQPCRAVRTWKSAFYEQVTGVKGLIFPFSFISVFALLLFWLRGMLLSTVFLCAL